MNNAEKKILNAVNNTFKILFTVHEYDLIPKVKRIYGEYEIYLNLERMQWELLEPLAELYVKDNISWSIRFADAHFIIRLS